MFISKLQITSALLFSVPVLAQAAPPYYPNMIEDGNRWTITAYDDSNTTHTEWATQGLCFYEAGTQGAHQLYYWVSDTFPDWNGRAVQEGDQVFLHGDYAADLGHDVVEFEITTSSQSNEGFGHWQEWREDGNLGITIGFLNAKLTRQGKCEAPVASQAIEAGFNINLPMNDNKEPMITPMGRSEKDVEKIERKVR